MTVYDFSELESTFAEIVDLMPDPFDSHDFLLALAQRNQVEYVSALYAYATTQEKPQPFQAVHNAIMHILAKRNDLVTLIRDDKVSKEIFGKSQACGEWKKVK